MLARLNKVQAELPFRPHHLRFSEPTGMRALASRSQKAGGREWQWKALVTLCGCHAMANFVQRGTSTMLG